ncbi:WD40 repeat-like protein [Pyrenochaeta sp. DS3sAY3a]|nr:WD40 repeat-like protein [Pyrenochaeta sp. DS3sAY3a]
MRSNLPCDIEPPMSPILQHECTRVPVTALASCGTILVAAEGPFLRFYDAQTFQFISSKRVFKSQAVHGISLYSNHHDQVTKLVIWGGYLVRALEFASPIPDEQHDGLEISLSEVARAPDWILDLASRPTILDDDSVHQKGTCAAVTAHNALLLVTIERSSIKHDDNSHFTVSISELTSSSRSILYSAHIFWESSQRALVAAGTAFGEIMYWSWTDDPDVGPVSRIHHVFLGHEGSIFGVQISKNMPNGCCQQLKRVLASCSDDRTIRIWDVSDVDVESADSKNSEDDSDVTRTRHTGFSNESFDITSFSSSKCIAMGWGHASRVWTVKFLESTPCNGSVALLSAGEDATTRTWELTINENKGEGLPYSLSQLDCASNHNGKNIWSTAFCNDSILAQRIISGGADSKITAYPLVLSSPNSKSASSTAEYTLDDVLSLAQPTEPVHDDTKLETRSSKKSDFFRSYCFIDEANFLLTTNAGKVLIGSLRPDANLGLTHQLSQTSCITQLDDLQGYSICTHGILPGIAFLGGARGNVYIYRSSTKDLMKIHSVNGKIGDIIPASISDSSNLGKITLLITLVGQKQAELLYVDIADNVNVFGRVSVPVFEDLTGSTITSMAPVGCSGSDYLLLGFRNGSIAAYCLENPAAPGHAALSRVIKNAHERETVTCLAWNPSSSSSTVGQLFSVGRNGRLAVYQIDLLENAAHLVHNLALPVGPNIESIYFHQDHLFVHGFSSKRWVLYDVTAEERIMEVETGGGHRSWAFQHHSSSNGGTLVWTRASSMRICSQKGANHDSIRSGGHGREIKSVAVSPTLDQGGRSFIATGAEDTDIKIFEYANSELICRRTIRKHTTGIQHLQWSPNGDYLFSSGGCEEFYVWRIRQLSYLDVGVVCEHVYTPESEHSDLRIMSFDVVQKGSSFIIAIVFSDSSIKVYDYAPAATRWQVLGRGTYFTSCLTQCIFLSPSRILTAGTDGHAVVWPAPSEMNRFTPESLSWQHPVKIHQNSSKSMASHSLRHDLALIVSGGDDGGLAFVLARTAAAVSSAEPASSYASPPMLVNRTHASAVTACAIIAHDSRILILTSGNDEWVRLWEVEVCDVHQDKTGEEHQLVVHRHRKIKTSVADVSSMVVLSTRNGDLRARVLLCGVGMEVITVDWESSQSRESELSRGEC